MILYTFHLHLRVSLRVLVSDAKFEFDTECDSIDPQEQRQVVLIKRVTNSVDRLSQALSDLTAQMEVRTEGDVTE